MSDQDLTFEQLLAEINRFPAVAKQAVALAPPDRMVDVLGTINSVEARVKTVKLTAAAELEPEDTGTLWRYHRGRVGKRTYNTPALLMSIGSQLKHDSMWETLRMLMFDKVIKISWSWTNFEKLFKAHNLEFRVARREVEDDDPDFDFGEYWDDGSAGYKPVTEGDGDA
jgi:hypothetical protein